MTQAEREEATSALRELKRVLDTCKEDVEHVFKIEIEYKVKANQALDSFPSLVKAAIEANHSKVQKRLDALRASVLKLDMGECETLVPPQTAMVNARDINWKTVFDTSPVQVLRNVWSLSPLAEPERVNVSVAYDKAMCPQCDNEMSVSKSLEFLPYCSRECFPGSCKPAPMHKVQMEKLAGGKRRRAAV